MDFVDTSVMDGVLTREISDALDVIVNRPRNVELKRQVLRRKPPLMKHMFIQSLSKRWGQSTAFNGQRLFLCWRSIDRSDRPLDTHLEVILNEEITIYRGLTPLDEFYVANLREFTELMYGPAERRLRIPPRDRWR